MRLVECSALVALALLVPRAACAPALLASDQGYFTSDEGKAEGVASKGLGRVVYETLGHTGLADLIKQVLHPPKEVDTTQTADGAGRFTVRKSDVVDRARLAAAPPEVVMVYAGSQPAKGGDLTRDEVAKGLKEVADAARSSVTFPHGALGDTLNAAEDWKEGDLGDSLALQVLAHFTDAKASGAAHLGDAYLGRGCDSMGAEGGAYKTLKPGDEMGDFLRQRTPEGTDLIVTCAPPPNPADDSDSERATALAQEVDSFASLVGGLRDSGLRHAALYASAATPIPKPASCSAVDEEEGNRRHLLFTGPTNPPPPIKRQCDSLCQVQTNIVSGLILFWITILSILFGYALMHNLDTPTRWEKPKAEGEQ